MWLKRLVGVVLVVTVIGLNAIIAIGLLNKPQSEALLLEEKGGDSQTANTLQATGQQEAAAAEGTSTGATPATPSTPPPTGSPSPTPASPNPAATPTPAPTPPPAATYCSGRTPCYGPSEVATRNSSGNCWGWNKDRVINISGFNSGYHASQSGIGSIEVSGVCGKDVSAALAGQVSAGGQTNNHKSSTKNNSNGSVSPYFIGWFDASKP